MFARFIIRNIKPNCDLSLVKMTFGSENLKYCIWTYWKKEPKSAISHEKWPKFNVNNLIFAWKSNLFSKAYVNYNIMIRHFQYLISIFLWTCKLIRKNHISDSHFLHFKRIPKVLLALLSPYLHRCLLEHTSVWKRRSHA